MLLFRGAKGEFPQCGRVVEQAGGDADGRSVREVDRLVREARDKDDEARREAEKRRASMPDHAHGDTER